MEPFFISHEEFWSWFNRDISNDVYSIIGTNTNEKKTDRSLPRQRPPDDINDGGSDLSSKRMKTKGNRTRHIDETEVATRSDTRYVILFGPNKPGKKSKVWTGDGYLSLHGSIAHIYDLKGKMLEEPTLLDDIDLKSVEELGELLIGDTNVQVIEVDRQ